MATQKPRCYLAISKSTNIGRVQDAITNAVTGAGFHPVYPGRMKARKISDSPSRENIIGEMSQSDCLVAELSESDPNIYYEIGLAHAMGKGVFLLIEENFLRDIPADLGDYYVQRYNRTPDGVLSLSRNLTKSLAEFRRFPRRKLALRNFSSQPFFIDWDSLSATDAENLCKELLTQMGFKRLDWESSSSEVDMIAELPKKDPDGFEYKELWLISMGQRASPEFLLDMALKDPDYLLHRLFRYADDQRAKNLSQNPISFTVLYINPKRGQADEVDLVEHWRRRSRRIGLSSGVRLRVWDQTYLTSLVHQFPQIGYKYFSDEGRLRSETRKSYEDLYRENSQIATRLTSVVVELEEEKRRRVSAERDAVWKDISFAAAHKIGNPIFAVETDLDPLLKRIKEHRTADAVEVVDNIRSAVEKAKGFVEQFKSLAKAQQIKLAPVQLRTILNDAFALISSHNISCEIDCLDDVCILGDIERLSECFDELAANSVHWFDKSERKISVRVSMPQKDALPSVLDADKNFALIHFSDNGKGIPLANKNRIFDAFFTTYDHGTGLGLALVKRIIEGHGGVISETGVPTVGADFEIYLPLSD